MIFSQSEQSQTLSLRDVSLVSSLSNTWYWSGSLSSSSIYSIFASASKQRTTLWLVSHSLLVVAISCPYPTHLFAWAQKPKKTLNLTFTTGGSSGFSDFISENLWSALSLWQTHSWSSLGQCFSKWSSVFNLCSLSLLFTASVFESHSVTAITTILDTALSILAVVFHRQACRSTRHFTPARLSCTHTHAHSSLFHSLSLPVTPVFHLGASYSHLYILSGFIPLFFHTCNCNCSCSCL